jgi:hypothetical protein
MAEQADAADAVPANEILDRPSGAVLAAVIDEHNLGCHAELGDSRQGAAQEALDIAALIAGGSHDRKFDRSRRALGDLVCYRLS